VCARARVCACVRVWFVEGEIMEDLNSNGRSERDTCCVHILSQRSSALNVREVQDSPHKSCMHR